MIVENESHWRTEDLESLLECVLGMTGFRAESLPTDFLLLFRTGEWRNCAKPTKPFRTGTPAACFFTAEGVWSNTRVINIRSSKRFNAGVLDQIARVSNVCEQDMPAACVVDVARAIGIAIGKYGSGHLDYSWAAMKSLRTRARRKRSKEAKHRKILALQFKCDELRRRAHRKIEDIEYRIAEIRRTL